MNEFWEKRKSSEKLLLVVCALAVVGFLISLAFPAQGGSKTLLTEAQASQKYQEAMQKRQTLDANIEKLSPRINRMMFTEAPEQLIPKVIQSLQKTAEKSGIHLREIKPLRAKVVDSLRKVPIGVTRVPMSIRFTTTDFNNGVVPFLYGIEDPGSKLVIEKFNVTAPDPKVRTMEIEVQIAFYTRVPSKEGDGTEPRPGV